MTARRSRRRSRHRIQEWVHEHDLLVPCYIAVVVTASFLLEVFR